MDPAPVGGAAQPGLQLGRSEIKRGKGPAPHDPGIYDARSVSQSVHGRMAPR